MVSEKKPSAPVHVLLDQPLDLRKDMLQSALLAAKVLEQYHTLRTLREEKKHLLVRFQKTVTSLHQHYQTLKGQVPVFQVPELKRKTFDTFAPQPLVMDDREKLIQKELDAIERKLASLG